MGSVTAGPAGHPRAHPQSLGPFLSQPWLWEAPFLAVGSSCRQPVISLPSHSPWTPEHRRSHSEPHSDDQCIYQIMGSASLQEKISHNCRVRPSPPWAAAGPRAPSRFLCWVGSPYLQGDPPLEGLSGGLHRPGPKVKGLVACGPHGRPPATDHMCWLSGGGPRRPDPRVAAPWHFPGLLGVQGC